MTFASQTIFLFLYSASSYFHSHFHIHPLNTEKFTLTFITHHKNITGDCIVHLKNKIFLTSEQKQQASLEYKNMRDQHKIHKNKFLWSACCKRCLMPQAIAHALQRLISQGKVTFTGNICQELFYARILLLLLHPPSLSNFCTGLAPSPFRSKTRQQSTMDASYCCWTL